MDPDYRNVKKTENNDPQEADDEITIIELEGEKFELVGTANVDGKDYVALSPFNEHAELIDEEEDGEFTILEICEDPDDPESCTLKTVDDEELYNRIGDEFIEMFASGVDDE